MRVLVVLIAAGLGWILIGVEAARAKLSPGSVRDYDYRIKKAWDYQQECLKSHAYMSEEYMRRKKILDQLVAEREAKYGKKDGIY
jgi:hypothetical protein